MGEWSFVNLYLLRMFIALRVSGGIQGIRYFSTGTVSMNLWVKATNFALRAFATIFARDISFKKNSLTIVIKI